MAAMSGVASRFFQKPSSNTETSGVQGRVLQVNRQEGFIAIDLGAEQGARSDRGIVISRDGVVFARGHIDRVYPTSSAVVMHNAEALQAIREGDSVSFSS